MYYTTTTVNGKQLDEFIAKYQDQAKFLVFCQHCGNYQTLWSCPPLLLDVPQFLQGFNYIYIIGVKVIYDEETIKSAHTAEKIKEITFQSLQEVKTKLAAALLTLEQQIPGSVSLSSGGCRLCQRCERRDDRPCRYPEKMRYSLDAFGFDLTAITSDLLQIELKWAKNSLPEYYTLIHALLTTQELDKTILHEMTRGLF